MTAQISDEDEQLIHERALALVEAHFDSAADRLVLLHASAMMIRRLPPTKPIRSPRRQRC